MRKFHLGAAAMIFIGGAAVAIAETPLPGAERNLELVSLTPGQQANILEKLKTAAMERRISVYCRVLAAGYGGYLVQISEYSRRDGDRRGRGVGGVLLMFDDRRRNPGDYFKATLYPSGARVDMNGLRGIPVYARDFDRALRIGEYCLTMEMQYTLNAAAYRALARQRPPTRPAAGPPFYIGKPFPEWFRNYYMNENPAPFGQEK